VSPFFRNGFALGQRVPLSVRSKTVSSSIVVVELLRVEVIYLHVNREREFWCSPGKTVIPARADAKLAAAERILKSWVK